MTRKLAAASTLGACVMMGSFSASAALVEAVEFYHAGFDHYFMTASPAEAAVLDAGTTIQGWTRTGQKFYVSDTGSPVCRFFSTSFAPKSSHFYTADAWECAVVKANSNWQYEDIAFNVSQPAANGSCASSSKVYRLYNNGQGAAPNHRYTTDLTLRAQMMAQGWIPEGNGVEGVVFCTAVAELVPSGDFDKRKSGPGVIRYFDFDSAAQLGGGYRANVGTFAGTSSAPQLDSSVKASGTSSLLFTAPSQSAQGGAGLWFGNFSTDLRTQFGESGEFFVQWRQRFNKEFVETIFVGKDGRPQGGIKQLIVGPGDTPSRIWNSCEAIHLVVQTYYQNRFPIVYNSCTGSASHPAYSGMYEPMPDGDHLLQNGLVCKRRGLGPDCFKWAADEWMTFQLGITTGPRAGDEFSNSRVRFWGAREGQPSVLLVDWKPGISGYWPLAAGPVAEDQRFGKIWLLPYMTDKDPAQIHPLGKTWYDEVIISTQRIPDPR